jgi:hypothetical protein
MDDEPLLSESNGPRTPDGRFGPNNKFGRGNPSHARMHALRATLLDAVDDGAMERVCKKLIALAEGGDLEAIRILFSYTIGKPPRAIEISGPDAGPLGSDDADELARILAACSMRELDALESVARRQCEGRPAPGGAADPRERRTGRGAGGGGCGDG